MISRFFKNKTKIWGTRRGENLAPQSLPLLDQQLQAGLRGDFRRGQEIADLLERETPNCYRAQFNRSFYKLRNGDLKTGLELLDAGRWIGVFGDKPLPTNKPIFRMGDDLRDKNLLMCSEGGLGDEIINIRFAKDFVDRGAKFVVACDPGLMSLFSRVPGVSAAVGHRRAPDVYHDYWVPAMSAARVLEYNYPQLTGAPYLRAHPEFQKKWGAFFKKYSENQRPRIGLRFYGNPKFEHEQFRRFPKNRLIQSLNGRPWANLQKEETHLPLETWDDTLAVLDQLDLVITSCTSVAHASAALGKKLGSLCPCCHIIFGLCQGTQPLGTKMYGCFAKKNLVNGAMCFTVFKSLCRTKVLLVGQPGPRK